MIMNNFFDNLEKISNNKNLLFDGALYVRNNFSTSVFHSIDDWNEYSLWKKFFPEDKLKEVYFLRIIFYLINMVFMMKKLLC